MRQIEGGNRMKIRDFKAVALLSGFAIAAIADIAPVQAQQLLRYDNGLPESHVLNVGPKHFMEGLSEATGGEMSMQHFYSSLQTLGESAIGLRDGVLDVGAAAPQYLPGEFPVNSFVSQLPGRAKSSVAMTGADTEFVLLNCEPCLKEFLDHNQVPVTMFSNPTYQLILGQNAKQVKDPADVKGLRLRSGGDYFRDWIEYFGGVAVTVPGPDTFDAFNSGILDGTAGAIIDITGFKLEELVSSVTMIDIGPWHSATFFDFRRDFWQGLSEDMRKALIDLTIDSQIAMSIAADKENQSVIDALAARQAIIQPSDAFLAAQEEFVAVETEKVGNIARDERGVAEGPELAKAYVELTRKWQKLAEEIDQTDPAQVRALYDREIFSKIDLAAYGM